MSEDFDIYADGLQEGIDYARSRYFWRGIFIGIIIGVGLTLLVLVLGCASTGGGSSTEAVGSVGSSHESAPLTPWLSPRPITIYEFNMTPDTIRHAYHNEHMFLWSYVSRQGVAVYSPMTGADIPTTPCVILSRRTM